MILPADKGNAVVLLDRAEYIEKMTTLLQDEETYEKIGRDPTRKIEAELQKLLAEVFKYVPPDGQHIYKRLLCHNGAAPAIYGVPKKCTRREHRFVQSWTSHAPL